MCTTTVKSPRVRFTNKASSRARLPMMLQPGRRESNQPDSRDRVRRSPPRAEARTPWRHHTLQPPLVSCLSEEARNSKVSIHPALQRMLTWENQSPARSRGTQSRINTGTKWMEHMSNTSQVESSLALLTLRLGTCSPRVRTLSGIGYHLTPTLPWLMWRFQTWTMRLSTSRSKVQMSPL